MKKVRFYLYFIILCMFLGICSVKASDTIFVSVTDEKSLDICLKEELACKLVSNITVTDFKTIDHDIILDLNGYSITPDASLTLKKGLIFIDHGAKLTINDSKGTGKISTGTSGKVWAAIQLPKDNTGIKPAELVVNNGTIEGYYYGITGNGNNHNTKVIINGGSIRGLNKEDSAGIFQPQQGDMIINGGSITGGTGIEIRSGNLTVNNGVITGIASKFIKMVNKSGTTTNGVGIAIAQHTTKNPIKVLIYNGNISGQYALYEWNPHKNSKEDLNKITLHIYGGNFTGLAEGVHAVYSEDLSRFISGGKFNTSVAEYLTEDAKVSSEVWGETNILRGKIMGNHKLGIILATIGVIGISASIFYYRKRFLLK